MHKWEVYMDQFGIWRAVSADNNWVIPNGTRVKQFKTERQAKKFTAEAANRMLRQQTNK